MNFDQFRRRPLDIAQGYKPLDFGAGGLNASLNQLGRLLSVNNYHDRHGYITLTSAAPFPEHERYNPQAVRAYRKSLIEMSSYLDTLVKPGWGLDFEQTVRVVSKHQLTKQEIFLLEDVIPWIRLTFDDSITVEAVAFAVPASIPYVIQLYTISMPEYTKSWLCWSGILSLQRCAYTQLTEGGVIPIPALHSEIKDSSDYLKFHNAALRASAEIFGNFEPEYSRTPGKYQKDGTDDILNTVTEEGRCVYRWESMFNPFKSGTYVYTVDVHGWHISPHTAAGKVPPETAESLLTDVLNYWHTRWESVPDDLILRRALSYGLACCVPTSDEATCIITDHMLLPLAWNRDAYYVARMLLSWQPEMAKQVRGHLIWMWEVAERVNGFWGRSYLANGRVKDRSFQLDQQLFPLLELAEYVIETGDRALLDRLLPQVQTLFADLLAHQAAFAPLFPTDETPADDPMTLPYHLSSHMLFWQVLKKLAYLTPFTPLPPIPPLHAMERGSGGEVDFVAMADKIHVAIQQYFVAEHDGQQLYSYATDGHGNHRFYHDANDFPLALAPIWGFCPVDDPLWRATLAFAFSPANEGGYYAGRLGSVHTPAPWPLGDVQDLLIARLINDPDREKIARQQLQFAAQWDGALPEAYDAETGAVVSRHWFAWPNAAYACVELGAFKP